MKIIYPYSMKLAKGYTYMLSIIQFLNELAKECDVILVSLDTREEIKKYMADILNIGISDRLIVQTINNRRFGIKSNKVFFRYELKKYISLFKDEELFIYTRDIKQMKYAIKMFLGKNNNIRFIFEAHQILSQNYCRIGDYINAKKAIKSEKFVFNNVDYLFSITIPLKAEIKKIFKNHHVKNSVLPVGFDKRFLSVEQRKKKYDVIYSGNFSEWKGIDTLIKALRILKTNYSFSVSAILIGADNIQKKYYERLCIENDVSDIVKIELRKEHKEIKELIANSAIGVVPTKYNGDGALFTSPLKLYEYLGSGLKVVVSRLPPITSAIPNELVYFFEPENPESLAKSILFAAKDKKFNKKNVREFARNYTWEKRVENFLSFLR